MIPGRETLLTRLPERFDNARADVNYKKYSSGLPPRGSPVVVCIFTVVGKGVSMTDQLTELKQKYQTVLKMIEQEHVRLQNVHIENSKLLIRGEAPSQDAKNRVWNQVKLIDAKYADLTLDLTVKQAAEGQA